MLFRSVVVEMFIAMLSWLAEGCPAKVLDSRLPCSPNSGGRDDTISLSDLQVRLETKSCEILYALQDYVSLLSSSCLVVS